AVFVQPLVREDGASLGGIFHAGVYVGAFVEEDLDVIEMVHVRLADRVIARLDVAVVGGKVKVRPAAFVREIDVGAVVEQVQAKLIEPVLGSGEKRAPAVEARLVDVRACRKKRLNGIKVVRTDSEDQRSQTAAIFGGCGSPADHACGDSGFVGSVVGCTRAATATTTTGASTAGGSASATGGSALAATTAPAPADTVVIAAQSAEIPEVESFARRQRRTLCRHLLARIVGFSQRGPAAAFRGSRLGFDIRATLDQEFDRVGMAFVGGPHQCRGAAQGFLRVDFRAVIEQRFDRIDVAGAGGFHQI